jgi:hypothetical protein
MIKFNRTYELTITGLDGEVQYFALPYSIDFAAHRQAYASANTLTLNIYNLATKTRSNLRKDTNDFDVSRRITLKVGYGDQLSTIFDGTLDTCWSERQGVNFITHITARDNGLVYSTTRITYTYADGETKQSVVDGIVKQLTDDGLIEGSLIGQVDGFFPKGSVLDGPPMEILTEICGNICFIDSNKIYVINQNSAIEGVFDYLSSETGLLNTPRLQQAYVEVELVMEPRVLICQKINLESTTADNNNNPQFHLVVPSFNGDYKVIGIAHSGMISPTLAGTATTKLTLSNEVINTLYKGFGL